MSVIDGLFSTYAPDRFIEASIGDLNTGESSATRNVGIRPGLPPSVGVEWQSDLET